ncbi:hypothetical protein KAI56_02880, partial [Candidatus Parcubacteria bacterium]|nr:hypothetical protein [Candidatus Parcubacteria bacterium]
KFRSMLIRSSRRLKRGRRIVNKLDYNDGSIVPLGLWNPKCKTCKCRFYNSAGIMIFLHLNI